MFKKPFDRNACGGLPPAHFISKNHAIKSYPECFRVHMQKFPKILLICQAKIAQDAIVGSFI